MLFIPVQTKITIAFTGIRYTVKAIADEHISLQSLSLYKIVYCLKLLLPNNLTAYFLLSCKYILRHKHGTIQDLYPSCLLPAFQDYIPAPSQA